MDRCSPRAEAHGTAEDPGAHVRLVPRGPGCGKAFRGAILLPGMQGRVEERPEATGDATREKGTAGSVRGVRRPGSGGAPVQRDLLFASMQAQRQPERTSPGPPRPAGVQPPVSVRDESGRV